MFRIDAPRATDARGLFGGPGAIAIKEINAIDGIDRCASLPVFALGLFGSRIVGANEIARVVGGELLLG